MTADPVLPDVPSGIAQIEDVIGGEYFTTHGNVPPVDTPIVTRWLNEGMAVLTTTDILIGYLPAGWDAVLRHTSHVGIVIWSRTGSDPIVRVQFTRTQKQ